MANFLQTFAVKYGVFTSEQLTISAKYDMLDCNRFLHDDIGGDTWAALKAINPNIEIFLYQNSRSHDDDDGETIKFLNNLGRWDISRGHSMGDLNTDNSGLFLLDSGSNRIYSTSNSASHVLDVGSTGYRNYWIEGTTDDIVGQLWEADGVFVDVVGPRRLTMSGLPVSYPTDALWATAMQNFINSIVSGLGGEGQKIWGNTEYMTTTHDYDAYVSLDESANPPYAMLNEAAFAVEFGNGDVQFYSETKWKLQVDLLSAIHNIKITYLSHTDLSPGQSGTDNWGQPVTFWEVLWYAVASYHIGKNTTDNNSYFGFSESYSDASWFDEYDSMNGGNMDLGNAVGSYSVDVVGGHNIYYRGFVDGYVYVNPTLYDVTNIALPETCKELTHANFKDDPATIGDVDTIDLVSHRGTFLLKVGEEGDPYARHRGILQQKPPFNMVGGRFR